MATFPDIITLVPAKDYPRKPIAVHTELLCFYCPYYRATLKGSFAEAGSKTLIVDTTHHTLSLAIGWLYTGHVNWSGDTDTEPYVSLYAFADSFNILALRRSTMSAIITFCRQGYHLAWTDAELAYSTLPHNSPLIRWLVDDRVNHWHPESVVPEPDYFQHAALEFLFEVMAGLARREGVFLDCEVCGCCNDFCAYHEHESLEERLATCGTGGGDDFDADAEVQEKD